MLAGYLVSNSSSSSKRGVFITWYSAMVTASSDSRLDRQAFRYTFYFLVGGYIFNYKLLLMLIELKFLGLGPILVDIMSKVYFFSYEFLIPLISRSLFDFKESLS